MNETIPSWLKLKDRALYYNDTGEFCFFVPEIFFERNHAISEGEFIHLIGMLNYTRLKPGSNEYTKDVKSFNFPTAFTTKPGRVEKVKNLKLIDSQPGEDYRILHYENNGDDQIVVSIEVPQDIANVEEFMQICFTTGKIPKNIRYDELQNYLYDNMKLNGNSYGITAQIYGIVWSEVCRDPNNLEVPYRLSKKFDEKNPTNYQSISIKEVPKIISPFTAVTTENWDEAVISACIIPPDQIKGTPMEKIMTGTGFDDE